MHDVREQYNRVDPPIPKSPSKPIIYPAQGSRDWSAGNYEGKNVGGYKIPSDPALQEQYFRDMQAENERLYREAVRDGIIRGSD